MSAELKARISAYKPNKGGKGSICVIGGSFEYTGAPFFSAISALRTGVDLSFVICDKNAASVIKSYSPELIVFGLLDRERPIQNLEMPIQVKNRITALVVGPGLSRNETIHDQVKAILSNLNETDIPIIFDGDGILLYKNNFSSFTERFSKIVLTPNNNEFNLLQPILDRIECVIYAKGEIDQIISTNSTIELYEQGCPRRCGGIGDVLSGVIAAILSMNGDITLIQAEDCIQCIFLSGKLVRIASKLAFEKKKRSMSAIEVIENLSIAFEQIFE